MKEEPHYNVYVELEEPIEGKQMAIMETGLLRYEAMVLASNLLLKGHIGVTISEVPA